MSEVYMYIHVLRMFSKYMCMYVATMYIYLLIYM